MRKLPLIVLLVCSFAHTQQAANWYQIALEGDTIQSGPATSQMQAGAGTTTATTWTAVVSVVSRNYPLTVSWISSGTIPIFGADPMPNTQKKIGVIKTSAIQTFVVKQAATGGTVTITVPALSGQMCFPYPATGTINFDSPSGNLIITIVPK